MCLYLIQINVTLSEKQQQRKSATQLSHHLSAMSVRAESLKLYRDILRASKMFTWRNPQGELWSEVLHKNARFEFEQARFESDPLVVARMLVVGRDALNQTTDRFMAAAKAVNDNIDKTRTS